MAKAAVKPATKKETVKTKPPAVRIEDLSELALANKRLEDVERVKTGGQSSFISLVTPRGQVLDKNNPSYMEGVKAMDYVIASKKVLLGPKLDVTIIGMFKIYAEVVKKENDSDLPKTVRFWMPEDAVQFPVTPGGIFDRELPNGNVLQPNHWVFVYLHDHPEIEDGLIAFRSRGNSFYSQLEKLVKAESSVVTELRFEVLHQEVYNEKFKKTDYYPQFTLTGHNYKLTDGKVVKTKDSDLDAAALKEILTRSNKVQESYAKARLVARQNVLPIAGGQARPALPAGKGYEEDEEDQAVNF